MTVTKTQTRWEGLKKMESELIHIKQQYKNISSVCNPAKKALKILREELSNWNVVRVAGVVKTVKAPLTCILMLAGSLFLGGDGLSFAA